MTIADLDLNLDSWDELLLPSGAARPAAHTLIGQLRDLGISDLQARQDLAELDILTMGITFTVYSDGRGIDRAWPLDVIPRIIAEAEWRTIELGLIQRLDALNHFIDDLYNDQAVIRDGIFPAEVLATAENFRDACRGVRPKDGVWAHISGSDLVRDADGTMYVLEDNLRVPSGVSYMMQNRLIAKRAFADVFERQSILPVDDYPDQLRRMLLGLSARDPWETNVAVLTPGVHNSAYFEHSFLAQRMGVALVEGRDLFVDADDVVYMRTIEGAARVDVIYRRIDDAFLDPEVFRPDSALGVPGLMRAWRAGNVAIANAPGAGVADDKLVYAWVPDLIQYYLDEAPLLPNVPTYRCFYEDELAYVLAHGEELVLKPTNESGGHGLTIGTQCSRAELDAALAAVAADPRNWVAQPVLQLSTTPTLCDGVIAPRHVDLRPFILSGRQPYVTTGGLTRVALEANSLIVNSSQGGGSKDTWIVADDIDLVTGD
jgi:uncharacterized circularly permuted ATP-grasp superfamily protein